MHLVSCENPKEIINPWTRQFQIVPCGCCSACLSNKSSKWISRLEQERLYSRYTVFFTLTYADEFLPRLSVVMYDPYGNNPDYFDQCYKLVHIQRCFDSINTFKHSRKLSDEYNSFETSVIRTTLSERTTQSILSLHSDTIPYLSVYDIQNFIKRFRQQVYRSAFGAHTKKEDYPEDYEIRYAICGEYGPTTYRPHYHGIFYFDRPEYVENLFNVLSASWQFGNIKYEYVSSSASSYVAQYISSTQHLPRVYQIKELRPFFITSKSTPIGIRSVEETTIRDIFFNSSVLLPVYDVETSDISFIPVWRTLEDRLFPKLPQYTTLDFEDRFRLLQFFAPKAKGDFLSFVRFVADAICYVNGISSTTLCGLVRWYLDNVCYGQVDVIDKPHFSCLDDFKLNSYLSVCDVLYSSPQFKRLYYVVRRIASVCSRFNVGVRTFCCLQDSYFSHKDSYNLKCQLDYERDFAFDNDSRFLLNLDPLRFNYYSHLDYSMMRQDDMLTLIGYGFKFSQLKQIHNDPLERKKFYKYLHFTNTLDFQRMKSIRDKIYSDTHKTKRKNEYLEKHPEYKQLY